MSRENRIYYYEDIKCREEKEKIMLKYEHSLFHHIKKVNLYQEEFIPDGLTDNFNNIILG